MPATLEAPKAAKDRKDSRNHGDIPSGVDFFKQVNYGGEPTHYPEEDRVVDVPQADNDKYLAADIGTNSKLYAWQHYNNPGNYGEWETDQPDLRSMGGISRFKVTENNTDGIWIKLTNNTGDQEIYTLYIHVSEEIGELTLPSNFDEYALVGIIPDNGRDHVVQIAVRDPNGVYVANGSCYLKSVGGDIILTEGPGFPQNMCAIEDDDRFNLLLNFPLPSGG